VVPSEALATFRPGTVIGLATVASCFASPTGPDSAAIMLRLMSAFSAVNSPVLPLQNLLMTVPSRSVTSLDSAVILIEAF